jgi:tetratricopeptide (TPR) repeat protein
MGGIGSASRAVESRSMIGAALLAVPGIGLGYAYLGRMRRAVLQLAGAVALAAIAAATDAADLPWLWWTVAAVWSAASVVDAWRLARRTPAGASWRAPVAVGAVVTCALVAGFVGYGAAAQRTFDDGRAALARGDCAAAVGPFGAMDTAYELTLSGSVPQARVYRAQCDVYLAAAGAFDRAEYEAAFTGYREARSVAPDTPLAPFLHEGIVRSLTERAGTDRAAGNHPEAVRWYRELLGEETATGDLADVAAVREQIAATHFEQADAARQQVLAGTGAIGGAGTPLLAIMDEFGDTTPAARVPQAFADLYAAATSGMAAGQFCNVVGHVDSFLDLPERAMAGLRDRAHGDRAESMLQCGIQRFTANDYAGAREPLERLVSTYPDAPQAAQARSAIIAAKVGEGTSSGAVVLPAPLGGDSPGRNPVTFYNATPNEVHVLVAGPTAHELTLPPCPGCPAEYASAADACKTFDGLPSATLRLGTGEFDTLSDFPTNATVDPLTDTFVVQSGYAYTNCLYVTPESPYDTFPGLRPFPELPDIPLPELDLPPDFFEPIEPPR